MKQLRLMALAAVIVFGPIAASADTVLDLPSPHPVPGPRQR